MITKRRTLIIAAVLICTVAAVALSRPLRATFNRVISSIISQPATQTSSTALAQSFDVEQRARVAHGWQTNPANSIARGSIIYYDATGRATGQYAITIFRGYPDRVRFEIDRGQTKEVSGFDQTSAWKGGVVSMKDSDARDIRSLARICPERLFVTRAAGAVYREAGPRIEDPPVPSTTPDWSTTPLIGSAGGVRPAQLTFDQIEITDSLGPAATQTNAGDVRRVYYYVDPASSTVSTARWLEPDNPRKSIDDDTASFTDIRVDFANWRNVNGVKWPFKVTHSSGGRIDFRIVLTDVALNRSLNDAVFQKP